MIRSGEYVGWGLGIAVFGGVLALAAALVADAVELLWIAVPAVVVGGVMAQIGTVAWGVRVGIRASRLDQ